MLLVIFRGWRCYNGKCLPSFSRDYRRRVCFWLSTVSEAIRHPDYFLVPWSYEHSANRPIRIHTGCIWRQLYCMCGRGDWRSNICIWCVLFRLSTDWQHWWSMQIHRHREYNRILRSYLWLNNKCRLKHVLYGGNNYRRPWSANSMRHEWQCPSELLRALRGKSQWGSCFLKWPLRLEFQDCQIPVNWSNAHSRKRDGGLWNSRLGPVLYSVRNGYRFFVGCL